MSRDFQNLDLIIGSGVVGSGKNITFWICLQGDQLTIAVVFWYLVKSDLVYSVHVFCTYTGQVTFHKVPEKHGHVKLVTLYLPDCSASPGDRGWSSEGFLKIAKIEP